jgi:hypothetical protein
MDFISVHLLFDETVLPSETDIFLLFYVLYRVNMGIKNVLQTNLELQMQRAQKEWFEDSYRDLFLFQAELNTLLRKTQTTIVYYA